MFLDNCKVCLQLRGKNVGNRGYHGSVACHGQEGRERWVYAGTTALRSPLAVATYRNGRNGDWWMVRNVFVGLWQLLFPPVCAVCWLRLAPGSVSSMCPACREKLVFLKPPYCTLCGMELAGDADRSHRCGECLRIPPPYTLARSLLRYERSVALLLRRLKYHGDTSVLPAIGELRAPCRLDDFANCSVIIPVPLHLARLRQRGLNQASLLAQVLFPDKEASIRRDLLVRTRNTPAQTSLSGYQRRRNLDGAFAVRAGMSVTGVVCLVDDVFTTGSTVAECSRVLLRHGADEVYVLTLARAARLR